MDPKPSISATELIEHMLEGVLITDAEGMIESVNSTFCEVTGYSPEELIGKNPRLLQSGKHSETFYKKMWTTIGRTGWWQGEIRNKKKNGQEYVEWLTISAIKNKRGRVTRYLGLYVDITRQKRAEERVRHMAHFDPLTKLPNRALFRDRLKQAITVAQRKQATLAVLFLDLDRVKVINDTLGHDIGDRLLQDVSRRIEHCLRETDTIARLGGDEFMLLLPDIKQPDDVTKISEKILESLLPSFQVGKHELYITASIGISFYPQDAQDAPTLLKNADTAMYRAKRLGRNNFQVFNPTMNTDGLEQLALEHSLRKALEKEEFVVYYQPQINIATGEVVGAEALVRWQHPELGLVQPRKFIHWAEDTGLIIPMGEWVLRAACQQTKRWQLAGFPHLRVSVNLSALQFKQKNLVEVVAKILRETGLAPDSLELEITESVVMEHSGPAMSVPYELKAMGLRLSIDDFGTGYSSLHYLKHLPVNTLKMDQSFIHDLTHNSHDAAIAAAVITLGHGLNLSVMAEGVENERQVDFLKHHKCDGIQGYYYSEPVAPQELEKFLNNRRRNEDGTLFSSVPA